MKFQELRYPIIGKVHKKLSKYVIKTPILNSSNNFFNTNLFLKLEFFQHSGCFKIRGAINNILNLTNKQKKIGVTAVSAGNHAIATSFAANKFAIKNKIFMYKSANKYRLDKVKSLNANLFLTDPVNAFKDVEKASKYEGFYFIHPFDGKKTIQGTASLGYEICEQIKKIDNIIISVGGGGLISGVGSIIKQKFPKCKIIGVEPIGANGMSDSLKKGYAMSRVKINSIADSLSPPLHMPYSFSICKEVIDEMVCVSDLEMINAMKVVYEKYKFVLEPACVAGIAALLGPLKNKFKNQNTLIILCGSNIDMKTWIKITKKIN
ncbi:MAG: Phenylserine dehydratase [Alphaproteobacteria bacterium MarineAlpha5_Bin8]|nr:MAG: Phenylserine dehydratase [Alphaproteobacteria bacterium MarineAlpha5_Bin7]PPR46974.1 MAG: Phenylserine dehydratase [Alphaproteobacteria bacterium MarineAlpha5_Bin8]PPR52541.1 MAG: Phenylserine dehydratase [Alphaproteobacteria bacterium MarineAlpha5_Bin6]